MKGIRLAALGAVLLIALVNGCSASGDDETGAIPDTLRVGVIPNISPEQQRARYGPFRDYLSEHLGADVELFVATDYAGVVAALIAEKVDVAYLGGLSYVQAEQQADISPLVTEIDHQTGTREYLSAIVVKSTSSYRSTQEVVAARGRFAFGDPSSTSGSLYPRAMLTRAGAECDTEDIGRCPPLSKVAFTGGHDATAQAVHNGSADAGGIELRILHRLERQGSVPKGALRIVDSRKVMGYPWVAREGMNAATREKLVAAFTEMKDPALLDLMRAKRYVAVSAADYTDIRGLAADMGFLTASE